MSYIKTPYIWILDTDLSESAKILTDKDLASTMHKCIDMLISTHLYMQGIRSKKIVYMYLSKSKSEFLNTYFSNFPEFKQFRFDCMSKFKKGLIWTISSKHNYDMILKYLYILISEYNYRFGKDKYILNIRDIANSFSENCLVNIISNNPLPLEWLLSKIKIPIQYMKRNRLEALRYWYSSLYKDINLFNVYSNDIPEIMLKNNKKTYVHN